MRGGSRAFTTFWRTRSMQEKTCRFLSFERCVVMVFISSLLIPSSIFIPSVIFALFCSHCAPVKVLRWSLGSLSGLFSAPPCYGTRLHFCLGNTSAAFFLRRLASNGARSARFPANSKACIRFFVCIKHYPTIRSGLLSHAA